jgi:hypothetical protein
MPLVPSDGQKFPNTPCRLTIERRVCAPCMRWAARNNNRLADESKTSGLDLDCMCVCPLLLLVEEMLKGTRVKLSQEASSLGLNLNAKCRNRRRCIEGTIISPTPVKQIVAVLWDDRIKAESWHVDFLEKISQADQ